MFSFYVSLMANFAEHIKILTVKYRLLEGNFALIWL